MDAVISMIILAAGLSTRMGAFKPMLPVGGVPAVLRCIGLAERAGIGDVVVVTGHNREELESAVGAAAPWARLAHNGMYREGMFSSVRAGVAALPRDLDGFFLLPADCCAVSPETLAALAARFTYDGGYSVIRPTHSGRRGHPPLIPARHIGPLLSYAGENGLKGFLFPLPTVGVETEDRGAFLDMDTAEDYARLLEHLGLPGYPNAAQRDELLSRYEVSQDIISHGEHVASVALELVRDVERGAGSIAAGHGESGDVESRGHAIDTDLLVSACLLHDISKGKKCGGVPVDHARAGMELLLREGYPRAATLVGSHMDLPEGVAGAISAVGETELLYLADKLCRRGSVVALEATMREISSKHPPGSEARARAESRILDAMRIYDIIYPAGNLGC